MKTLDEVIACLDGCGHIDCDDCPYHYEDEKIEVDDCAQSYKDALHYLKEYKSDKDEIDSTRLAYLDVLTDYVALKQYWAEQQANPPLTWDELKTMEGKPVLVHEYDPIDDTKGWHRCRWYLVNFVNDTYFYVYDMDGVENYFDLSDYGKTWTAYRKEKRS